MQVTPSTKNILYPKTLQENHTALQWGVCTLQATRNGTRRNSSPGNRMCRVETGHGLGAFL